MKKITVNRADIAGFKIVYGKNEPESVAFAAEELARYIKAACGAELPIVQKEAVSCGCKKIVLGAELNPGLYEGTGEEDWIRTVEDGRISISGGYPRGIIYGVYAFLEDVVGWRFLTPDTEVLQGGDVDIPCGSESWHPVMEWRDVCSAVYWPYDIACKRRLNSSYARNLDAKRGGSYFYPGRFIHTMESLLDVPQHQQPCLSDPAVLEKCIKNVRQLLRAYPDARVISVSQNDCHPYEETWCKCPECSRIDEEEGSHAGTMLRFVNAVADAIKDEFPKVKIMTLAYLHTIECPKITRPRPNVIIEFAPMTMCYAHPVDAECNRNVVRDFEDWSKVTDQIFVWDYMVDFSFSVPTFPNFGLLQRNFRYYADHSVTGMFCQGDTYIKYGETSDLSELRSYMLSKLLCDPYMSESELMGHRRDFLVGYYGKGGCEIGRYVDILSEIIDVPDHHIGCFNNPNTLYPIPRFLSRLDEMQACWDKAAALAETDAQRSHIERGRLGFTYSKLLYGFDTLCAKSEESKAAILAENAEFYRLLKKYHVRPRGSMSALPELTDMSKNMAAEIYWSDVALAMLSPDQL